MTPDQILCRLCRNSYDVPEGCAVCTDAKANVLWPAVTEDSEAADLTRLARRTLRMLEENIKRLEHSMKTATTREYFPQHGREAAALAKAMSALLTEARKVEEREEKRVRSASFEDQVELYFEWWNELPREYKAKVLGRFEEHLLPAAPADVVDG